MPVSLLVVLSAVASNQDSQAGRRALDTVIGAVVGVAVSLALPASRLVDARQTLDRLGGGLEGVLNAMGSGLQQSWSADQAEEWRRTARTVRDRLVDQAAEAVGDGRGAARWNFRDRRHVEVLGRYEAVMPRLERAAIGVSVIARGLDDQARLAGTMHGAMPAMGALLVTLARAIRALTDDVLGDGRRTLADGSPRSAPDGIVHAGRVAAGSDGPRPRIGRGVTRWGAEWLGYAALLVQVDRIVGDLSARLPG